MKTLQRFTDEYLSECRRMPADGIARFLEEFRLLNGPKPKSRLISMKVPEPLLAAFKARCRIEGEPYQARIKRLMRDWLEGV